MFVLLEDFDMRKKMLKICMWNFCAFAVVNFIRLKNVFLYFSRNTIEKHNCIHYLLFAFYMNKEGAL